MAEKKAVSKKTATKTAAKASVAETKKKASTNAKAQPRLKALYNNELKAKLKKELGLDNINQVPELKKVVVSAGVYIEAHLTLFSVFGGI
jgi:hypothetical protein